MKAFLFGALFVLGSSAAVAQTTGMEGLICEIDSPRMPRPTYMAVEIVKKASGLEFQSPGLDVDGKATIDATFVEDEIEYILGGCKVNAGNRLGF